MGDVGQPGSRTGDDEPFTPLSGVPSDTPVPVPQPGPATFIAPRRSDCSAVRPEIIEKRILDYIFPVSV